MKKLALILLISISVFPQENNNSLYARGLQACFGKETAHHSKSSERDSSDVFVEYNFDLTRALPTRIGEMKIQYLNDLELVEKYKALPKAEREQGLQVIKLFPLYDKDDKLVFAYNNYLFKYSEKGGLFSRKKLIFGWSLEGGCHAYIGFDPGQKKFTIEKVEFWGV